jgi:hypothetical protein
MNEADIIASVASNLRLKGWGARTNISKQGGTFWQGELASLRMCVSGASGPLGCGTSTCILSAKAFVAKEQITWGGIWLFHALYAVLESGTYMLLDTMFLAEISFRISYYMYPYP